MSIIYPGDEDLEYRIVSTQLSKGNNYEERKQQREPSVPNDHGTNRPTRSYELRPDKTRPKIDIA
ncbi:hypothetical protein V1477_002189 [Vespula maculifrons]|uniref:Uncharacterized protein n=1 Tax=Vespula maculifrons TaxID=7453 RepID=A0ABD2CX78_VESMC